MDYFFSVTYPTLIVTLKQTSWTHHRMIFLHYLWNIWSIFTHSCLKLKWSWLSTWRIKWQQIECQLLESSGEILYKLINVYNVNLYWVWTHTLTSVYMCTIHINKHSWHKSLIHRTTVSISLLCSLNTSLLNQTIISFNILFMFLKDTKYRTLACCGAVKLITTFLTYSHYISSTLKQKHTKRLWLQSNTKHEEIKSLYFLSSIQFYTTIVSFTHL